MVIQVSVPESAQVGDHVEYRIEVAINGLPCSHSWRRFRNLYEVFRRLRRRHPDLPEAPKKRWPMMGMRSCDIEERRLSIQEHLRSLFAHRCCASDDLRQLVGYHQAVQRRQHCVAAEVQAGLCARTLLARYWRAFDAFRSGTSLQETLAKRPRRVRAATAQTDAGAGVLLLSESAVVDAGVDASASVEERLGVLVHKYQQECGEATKRAVSAELLATTLRHNRESMDCITKTCVFMPSAEGEGEPGDRSSASEGLRLGRGGGSLLQHRSSSPNDRSAARLRKQPESPRGGSNQNNSSSSSNHNNNIVSSGSGDRDATIPLNKSFSRSFAGRSLGGGGLSLTATSLAGGVVGSKHSPASAVSAANSFAAANASDGTLPPYAPYGMAHSARVRIRSASVARYEQKNGMPLPAPGHPCCVPPQYSPALTPSLPFSLHRGDAVHYSGAARRTAECDNDPPQVCCCFCGCFCVPFLIV